MPSVHLRREASGYADEVIHFNEEPRALAIERLTEKALDDLESSGGVRNLAALSSIEENHVPYLGNAWFRVKVSVRSPIAPMVQFIIFIRYRNEDYFRSRHS